MLRVFVLVMLFATLGIGQVLTCKFEDTPELSICVGLDIKELDPIVFEISCKFLGGKVFPDSCPKGYSAICSHGEALAFREYLYGDIDVAKKYCKGTFLPSLENDFASLTGECFYKMLPLGQDSIHFKYSSEELNVSEELDEVSSLSIISFLRKRQNCKEEVPFYNSVECLSFNNHFLPVCYVSTEMGFFYLMQDYMDNINIIFNRWD